jgi:hypothetical protein
MVRLSLKDINWPRSIRVEGARTFAFAVLDLKGRYVVLPQDRKAFEIGMSLHGSAIAK